MKRDEGYIPARSDGGLEAVIFCWAPDQVAAQPADCIFLSFLSLNVEAGSWKDCPFSEGFGFRSFHPRCGY